MGKTVEIDLSAKDVPPWIKYADWTLEELEAAIAEDEANPPKTWEEAWKRSCAEWGRDPDE